MNRKSKIGRANGPETENLVWYYFGNKRAEFPSFRRIPQGAREPESIEKTGCRIKSGMTNFEVFTCRCNKWLKERKTVLKIGLDLFNGLNGSNS